MSSVASISSVISSLFLDNQNSSTSLSKLTELLTGGASAESSGSSDAVSISSPAQSLRTSLFSAPGLGSSDSSAESDQSDFLLSALNTKLLKHNPGMAKIINTVQASESSSEDSSTASAVDILSMSATDLLSIINKYQTLLGSGSSTSSIDETV